MRELRNWYKLQFGVAFFFMCCEKISRSMLRSTGSTRRLLVEGGGTEGIYIPRSFRNFLDFNSLLIWY